MRVVDRKTFLDLPAGTIFAKLDDQSKGLTLGHGEMMIKGDTMRLMDEHSSGDFIYQDLDWSQLRANDSSELCDAMLDMIENGKSHPMDYDENTARDGLYERDEKYVVWEKYDAIGLVDCLLKALQAGYEVSTDDARAHL